MAKLYLGFLNEIPSSENYHELDKLEVPMANTGYHRIEYNPKTDHDMPVPKADWGEVRAFGIFDAMCNGKMVAWGILNTHYIHVGDKITYKCLSSLEDSFTSNQLRVCLTGTTNDIEAFMNALLPYDAITAFYMDNNFYHVEITVPNQSYKEACSLTIEESSNHSYLSALRRAYIKVITDDYIR